MESKIVGISDKEPMKFIKDPIPPSPKGPTLLQRMNSITEEIQSIEKRGYNEYSNYRYVMAVDVIEEVRKLLVKHGVLCTITELELKRESIAGKNSVNFHTQLKSRAFFWNIDDATQGIQTDFWGVASDTLDKDIYKAKTNGLKYLFIQTFKIPADLPDAEKSNPAEKMGPRVTGNRRTLEEPNRKDAFDL